MVKPCSRVGHPIQVTSPRAPRTLAALAFCCCVGLSVRFLLLFLVTAEESGKARQRKIARSDSARSDCCRLSCHSRPRKCSLMHQSSHRKCCMVGVSFNRSGQYQCVLTPGQRHPAKRRVLSSTRFPCLWGVPSLGPRQWAAQTPPPAHHTHC